MSVGNGADSNTPTLCKAMGFEESKMFEYMKLRIENWKAKQVARREAAMKQDHDGYSPSHDKTFVWPPQIELSPPWWSWVGLAIVAGVAIHHFITFS